MGIKLTNSFYMITPSLLIKKDEKIVVLRVYGYDLLITGNIDSLICELKAFLPTTLEWNIWVG